MEDSALTPQVVARIVLEEQEKAQARIIASQKSRKSTLHICIPYEKPGADTNTKSTQSTSHNSGNDTAIDGLEEGEIAEKEIEDSNVLITNASSPHSSLTLPSSSHTPTTPLISAPATPRLAKDLCTRFTSTGSCTAICTYAHDPTKLAICLSRTKRLQCDKVPTCRQSHVWTFNNAPSCANFLLGRHCMRGTDCGFAHNEKVFPTSGSCRAFSRLGYCELGGECNKIHWFNWTDHENGTSHIAEIFKADLQEKDVDAKMKAAKAKLLKEKRARLESKEVEKARRKTFNGDMWAKEPEEFLTLSEAKGDLALQEDFVPF